MILAIDPGSDKTGMALVEEDGRLRWKAVMPSSAVPDKAARLAAEGVRAVVMGNGTRHREMRARVEAALAAAGCVRAVELVDEKYTTEMGKARYLADHPPKGLARLLPQGMRTVSEPVDDYVAWIIGQIYLGVVRAEDVGHRKV